MLAEGRVQAEHLWKRFPADRRLGFLADDLEHAWHRVRGGRRRSWRYVLRDIDLDVAPGESVAIIGDNGSGKSTLLKILNGTMQQYAGRVETTGRIGALVDVRSGLHPELTGRENIHLYGSLFGVSRRNLRRSFDDIVAFAELQDALGRRVKHYSTGMQVRLGFAVAAFLEPAVLLVDEVLAVGDVAFQQRCLARMRDLLAGGTTLLLVSHDAASVASLCDRAVWLHDGSVRMDGACADVLRARARQAPTGLPHPTIGSPLRLTHVRANRRPETERPFDVTLELISASPTLGRLVIGIGEERAVTVAAARELHLDSGLTTVRCTLQRLPLAAGSYGLWVGVAGAYEPLVPWSRVASIDVVGPSLEPLPRGVVRAGRVHVDVSWNVQSVVRGDPDPHEFEGEPASILSNPLHGLARLPCDDVGRSTDTRT